MQLVRLFTTLLAVLVLPQVVAAAPYASNLGVLDGLNPPAYVSLTSGNCSAFNSSGTGTCTKTAFAESPSVIGDSASCVQLSGGSLDPSDWNVLYQFNDSHSTDFGFVRYAYFAIAQSCDYSVALAVETDGNWSSNNWTLANGTAIIEMSCIAPNSGDCVGTYDNLQSIRACKVPATASCLATTSSTPPTSFANPAALSGWWFDPTYTGSGFDVQMASAGLLVAYYGWDKAGTRLWLTAAIGPTQVSANVPITLNLNATAGGTFLSPAPPSTEGTWGTLTLTFTSCTAATATLNGSDGTVSEDLQLLAGIVGMPGC